jgi:hypothetical protein
LPNDDVQVDQFTLAQFRLEEATTPSDITISATDDLTIVAMTLVDTRTGDFVQLTPPGWRRVYSGDVKIYENLDVLPRAFVVHEASIFPDTYDGTEQALAAMRDKDFDPAQMVVINSDSLPRGDQQLAPEDVGDSTVEFVSYTPTEVVIEVSATADGYLLLTDAFYTGWEIEGRTEIYRGDVMFRAIPVVEGDQTFTLTYKPFVLKGWIFTPLVVIGLWILSMIGARYYHRGSAIDVVTPLE